MIRFSIPTTYFRRLGEFDYLYERLLPVGLVVGTILASISLAYILVDISPTFAILGMLAIPAGLIIVTRPDIGLLLIIFMIPLENLNEFGSNLTVLQLLSVAVFGGMVVHFLIFKRKDSLVGAPQNWLLILFLLAVILSNFVAIDPSRTLERTFRLLRTLILYVIIINVIRSEKGLRALVWVLLISGFVSALHGIYGYYFDSSLLAQQAIDRVAGTMDDPNRFATEMVVRLPLILCLLSVENGRLKQTFLLVMFAAMAYGIILAGSRGGLMATGLTLALFPFFQKKKIAWLILVGLIAVTGLFIMPLEMKKRVGLVEASADENLGNVSSTNERKAYQIYGWQLWQQHPILGVGFDGFAEAFTRSEYRFLQKGQSRRIAHNLYLEIAVGTGLIGLIPFISLLVLSLLMAWKYASYGEHYLYLSRVSAGLFIGQAGLLLASIFLSLQYSKLLYISIAMVVVIQNLINMAESKQSSPASNHQRPPLPSLPPNFSPHHR